LPCFDVSLRNIKNTSCFKDVKIIMQQLKTGRYMKKAVIIVIDSAGIGAMPDAPDYSDLLECNTIGDVA